MSPGGNVQNNPTWQYNPESGRPAGQAGNSVPQSQEPQLQYPQRAPEPQPTPAPQVQTVADDQGIAWTASEFIAHSKSAGWYGLLALGALAGAGAVYLLTSDVIAASVIVIVAILFGFAAARKPRELQYVVNSKGINIGGKPYPYSGFRSFAIVQEGGVDAIWFMPLKRFKPIVSIYFDPNDGDRIIDVLSQSLPVENREPDPVDRLMHRIRF